jgi:hypothetical protein
MGCRYNTPTQIPEVDSVYRFARDEEIDLTELRTRLRKMTDEDLLRFGKRLGSCAGTSRPGRHLWFSWRKRGPNGDGDVLKILVASSRRFLKNERRYPLGLLGLGLPGMRPFTFCARTFFACDVPPRPRATPPGI